MTESRCATVEDVAQLRERIARVEGSHEDLSTQFGRLSDRVDIMKDTLGKQIAEQAGQTREYVDKRVKDGEEQTHEIMTSLAKIQGGVKVLAWGMLFLVTVITGLLGWSQIGDWAWVETLKLWSLL